jgi:hypothetical protein
MKWLKEGLNRIPAWRMASEVMTLPEVTIRMSGDERSRSIYEKFTRPHPRYRIIQSKRWGVALVPLPEGFEQFLRGKPKEALRTNRNRCIRLGYTFAKFEPLERLDEILAVNQSVPERQGRPMEQSYLELDALRAHYTRRRTVYGVFDSAAVLKAYAAVPVVGEVAILTKLLGHGDALANGVMYFCVSEVIRVLIQRHASGESVQWLLYDTFFGASAGLRYFKERMGFRPYKVRWVWAS